VEARIENPAMSVPGAFEALQRFGASATNHYTEPQLAALVVSITTINAWNRLDAVTGQVSGAWVEQLIPGAGQPA
jgi:alkylhydroperoxidase family enzyme